MGVMTRLWEDLSADASDLRRDLKGHCPHPSSMWPRKQGRWTRCSRLIWAGPRGSKAGTAHVPAQEWGPGLARAPWKPLSSLQTSRGQAERSPEPGSAFSVTSLCTDATNGILMCSLSDTNQSEMQMAEPRDPPKCQEAGDGDPLSP